MNDLEAQIQARAQQLLKEQIGELVLACARRRAEAEVLQAVLAGAERRGRPDGAQGADGPGTEGGSHG